MSYDYNGLVTEITSNRKKLYERQQKKQEKEKQHENDAMQDDDEDADDNADDDGDDDDDDTLLQKSLDGFATLSTYCPMTPLLWMQYAHDTYQLFAKHDPDGAMEMQLQTLELALQEFPGCALLQYQYCKIACQSILVQTAQINNNDDKDNDNDNSAVRLFEKVQSVFDSALQMVGQGSHRNQDFVVAAIYTLYSQICIELQQTPHAIQVWYNRSEIPMKEQNDSLSSQAQEFCKKYKIKQIDFAQLEMGRRLESKIYGSLVTFEDEIDMAMHQEGILLSTSLSEIAATATTTDLDSFIQQLLIPKSYTNPTYYLMGYGGLATANAVIQYARACAKCETMIFRQRCQNRHDGDNDDKNDNNDENDDDDDDKKFRNDAISKLHALVIPIYERGIAECPTVEALWTSYIQYLLNHGIISKLQTVTTRAVRNCPYSVTLVQERLCCHLTIANHGQVIFDPEVLDKMIKEVLDLKFITNQDSCLELYLTGIRLVKRRMLSLLAVTAAATTTSTKSDKQQATTTKAYDESEPIHEKGGNNNNNTAATTSIPQPVVEELKDLCEDLRDMYDTVDTYLRENYSKWSSGRAKLWSDRSQTESYLLLPLLSSLQQNDNHTSNNNDCNFANDTAFKIHDKLTKLHQPAHPQSMLSFVQYAYCCCYNGITKPIQVLKRLRQIRGLYQKGMSMIGKPKTPDETSSSSFEICLRYFCQEYIRFEECFGSKQSLKEANKLIEKKLLKLLPAGVQQQDDSISNGFNKNKIGNKKQSSQHTQQEQQNNFFSNQSSNTTAQKRKITTEKSSTQQQQQQQHVAKKPKTEQTTKEDSIAINSNSAATLKTAEDATDTDKEEPDKEEPKKQQQQQQFKFHPFTIRVSNLSLETQDMDLVDLFTGKIKSTYNCGAIVHAKIIREKSFNKKNFNKDIQKSKGWGLVQFEERESVEKALQLDNVIGLHDRLVHIEPSHMAAVSLVPPGMHRVNPKGEGKSTKRNLKRTAIKQQQQQQNDKEMNVSEETKNETMEETNNTNDEKQTVTKQATTKTSGVLSFQPRNVVRGRKVKVALPKKGPAK